MARKIQTTFRIDADMWGALQHELIRQGRSMNSLIEELVTGWLRGGEVPAPPVRKPGTEPTRQQVVTSPRQVPGDAALGEDAAVAVVLDGLFAGCLHAGLVSDGRAVLTARQNCCVAVKEEALLELNSRTALSIWTKPHLGFASRGERVALFKAARFEMTLAEMDELRSMLARGPLIEGWPIESPTVGVLYCCDAVGPAFAALESEVKRRLTAYGARPAARVSSSDPEALVGALTEMLQQPAPVILIVGVSGGSGPDGLAHRVMQRAGSRVERISGATPEDGMLVGDAGRATVVFSPNLAAREYGLADRILPALLAGYRVEPAEATLALTKKPN
jgi:hypothetical protein